jgi:hypothetical protein
MKATENQPNSVGMSWLDPSTRAAKKEPLKPAMPEPPDHVSSVTLYVTGYKDAGMVCLTPQFSGRATTRPARRTRIMKWRTCDAHVLGQRGPLQLLVRRLAQRFCGSDQCSAGAVVEHQSHRRTRFLYAAKDAPNSLSSARSSGTI